MSVCVEMKESLSTFDDKNVIFNFVLFFIFREGVKKEARNYINLFSVESKIG